MAINQEIQNGSPFLCREKVAQKSPNEFAPKILPCQNVASKPAPRFVEKSALQGFSAIQQSDVAMGQNPFGIPWLKRLKISTCWQMGGACPPNICYFLVLVADASSLLRMSPRTFSKSPLAAAYADLDQQASLFYFGRMTIAEDIRNDTYCIQTHS